MVHFHCHIDPKYNETEVTKALLCLLFIRECNEIHEHIRKDHKKLRPKQRSLYVIAHFEPLGQVVGIGVQTGSFIIKGIVQMSFCYFEALFITEPRDQFSGLPNDVNRTIVAD